MSEQNQIMELTIFIYCIKLNIPLLQIGKLKTRILFWFYTFDFLNRLIGDDRWLSSYNDTYLAMIFKAALYRIRHRKPTARGAWCSLNSLEIGPESLYSRRSIGIDWSQYQSIICFLPVRNQNNPTKDLESEQNQFESRFRSKLRSGSWFVTIDI